MYTPDFLIRKKNGKILIVEIKAEKFREEQKEMAMREIEILNPQRIKYEILFSEEKEVGFNNLQKIEKWLYGE